MIAASAFARSRVPLDPYRKDVVLHLRGRGTDGSSTIIDSSKIGHSITAGGNAQIDNGQPPPIASSTRDSSILLDGNGDYLEMADHAGWDCNGIEYTWETFYKLTGTQFASGGSTLFSQIQVSVNSNSNVVIYTTGPNATTRNGISLGYYVGGTFYSVDATGLTIAFDAWHHVAVCKYLSGGNYNNVRIFHDGALEEDSVMSGGEPNASSRVMRIGCTDTGSFQSWFGGWIGLTRFSKGVARYAADFKVPTIQPAYF